MSFGALADGRLRTPGPWIAVFLLGSAAVLTLYSTQPLLTEFAKWGRVDAGSAALTISATTLGVALLAPVAGSISDRLGRKRVMLFAIAAMVAATVLCATAPTFTTLLVFRVLQGAATPFVFAVAIAYIVEETMPAHTAAVNSVYVAGTAFGGFAGRMLSGLILDISGSWRLTFVATAILLLLVLASLVLWLPRERRFVPTSTFASGAVGMGRHLRDWRIIATCLVGAALLLQQVVTLTFGSLHLLQDPFGLSPTQVGMVFVIFLAPVALTPFTGSAVRRFGPLAVLWSSLSIGALGIALTLVQWTPAVIAGLALSCIAVFAGQSCATGFIARHAILSTSAAVGMYLTSYYLGGTIGATLGAPVYARLGWAGCVALVLAVMALSAAAATAAWRRQANAPAS